ncbi:hypothetical protein NOR51B_2858 [Luminiphilus syltensis NOR5-1B]|uniref:Uncharacterized protein n=2 Tax=Luminiphilus TaxID=1341118 RepID=B8KX04_9GAMM|nr:hypothetical protein NOR51B_2858 [Luminiphilus syltensis NOR5-1B]
MARLVLTISLVIAAIACAWAWQLQQMADGAIDYQNALQQRVADLEALLSDTDESVNQSAAALGAQLRVVDKETRRLEQRRREHDARIDKLEKQSGATDSRLASLGQLSAENQQNVASMSKDLAALKKTAGDLERIAAAASRAQEDIERMADGLNRSNLEQAALAKKVSSNEEWIGSINAFRRQVNTRITQLEQSVRGGQVGSATSP